MIGSPAPQPFEQSAARQRLPVALAVLSVPFFGWAVLAHFQAELQPRLREACQAALSQRPEFAGVTVRLEGKDCLDAQLAGRVDSPELRRAAQLTVDAVPGARARDLDNHVIVTSRVSGNVQGQRLELSGYLPSMRACEQLIHLLGKERPDLSLDTSGLLVCQEAEPVEETGPSPLAWPAHADDLRRLLGRPPSLTIEKDAEGVIQLSGEVPGTAWKKSLREVLLAASPRSRLEDSALRSGLLVSDAGFTRSESTPELLREMLALPGAMTWQAPGGGPLTLKAPATAALARRWQELAARIQPSPPPECSFRLYPSLLHMPGYEPLSGLDKAAAAEAQAALKKLAIFFEAGSTEWTPKENPKLQAILDLLLLPPEGQARWVVGAHVELTGSVPASQRRSRERATAVAAWLTRRGLPPGRLEVIDFHPVADPDPEAGEEARALSRRAEVMLR